MGVDIDEENNILYLVDKNKIYLLNLKFKFLKRWTLPIPGAGGSRFRGGVRFIKLTKDTLYLTVGSIHQIFLCNKQNGNILNQWGTTDPSSKEGEFSSPYGITIENNNKLAYICDSENHRVQILKINENGKFFKQWGKGNRSVEKGEFFHPCSIYHSISESVIYVGDDYSVQLFTDFSHGLHGSGLCIQRLGDKTTGTGLDQFFYVAGMCVIDDQLYVSDWNNERITIFKKQM